MRLTNSKNIIEKFRTEWSNVHEISSVHFIDVHIVDGSVSRNFLNWTKSAAKYLAVGLEEYWSLLSATAQCSVGGRQYWSIRSAMLHELFDSLCGSACLFSCRRAVLCMCVCMCVCVCVCLCMCVPRELHQWQLIASCCFWVTFSFTGGTQYNAIWSSFFVTYCISNHLFKSKYRIVLKMTIELGRSVFTWFK